MIVIAAHTVIEVAAVQPEPALIGGDPNLISQTIVSRRDDRSFICRLTDGRRTLVSIDSHRLAQMITLFVFASLIVALSRPIAGWLVAVKSIEPNQTTERHPPATRP